MSQSTQDQSHRDGLSDIVARLSNVDKIYDNGVVALRGFNLEVRRGEFLSLLGPSGCGKSTALQLIAGLSRPTAGDVKISLAPTSAHLANGVGFVFQEPTLMPWATVFDNVQLPLKLAKTGRVEAASRVNEVLAGVGLSDFTDVYPRELSGGMKMRVSLARALVTDPEILLLDEPFAALDEITRFRLNNDLRALWRRLRTTVIFVTHSVFESVYLSQRVVVMASRPGHVRADLVVEAPEPRTEDFRTSAGYAAQCRQVSVALADASSSGLAVDEAAR
jgi:NitT/TauT family transport system ATP-binding protein